ncbi:MULTISPECIES: hypothetical protein [unclassified Nocardioides]|uniref:hypothetical protein n=1 Tax=unclassified Nocardioides TaxID=2615069 RepID=UPI00112160ED|nr:MULTISPECIES: hypothetical protein [unclassified Nocardioides]
MASLTGSFGAYKVVAHLGSTSDFNDYSIARRLISFLVPLFAFGSGISLPLRISIRPSRRESLYLSYVYVLAATLVALVLTLTLTLSPGVWLRSATGGLDGIQTLLLLVTALSLTHISIVYSYLRGYSRFGEGALLLSLSHGVFPLVATSFTQVWPLLGIFLWGILNLFVLTFAIRRAGPVERVAIPNLRPLLWSSATRVPGDLAFAGLSYLPVLFAANLGSVEESATVAIFFVMIGVIVAVMSPVSTVLLPHIGSLVSAHGTHAARRYLVATVLAAVIIATAMAVPLLIAPNVVLDILLTPAFASHGWILVGLTPSIYGLALFVSSNSVLSGLQERPMAAYLSMFALIVMVSMLYFGPSTISYLLISADISFLCLGIGTTVVSYAMTARS